MVKVKVIQDFYDKYTGDFHKEGDLFEATEERIAEIMDFSKYLIELVEEKTEPVKKTRRKAGDK